MHDSSATIMPSVRSLLMQKFTDWELILIDDGSKDDGPDRVTGISDPRIRVVLHKERRGLASRLNEALNLARGSFIARMDADDICYPERLDAQVSLLKSNPLLDVVASKALVFRGEGQSVGVFPVAVDHAEISARPMSGFYFPHPTWCGKVEWFQKFRYDERMFKAQDQELLLRAAATSHFSAVDRILLGYRQERLGLMKSFRGRVQYAGALWRQGQRTKNRARSMKAIVAQSVKFFAEAALIGLGSQDLLVNRKYLEVSKSELDRWRSIWNAVNVGDIDSRLVMPPKYRP
jgi:glycosyltransferase involved in cell wall biosynthesis